MTLIKEQLEADLREAQAELQALEKRLADRPELGMGKADGGAYLWEMALARKERVGTRIDDLKRALREVRDGTYGRCKGCGAQIDPERLEILSTTSLCVACAREESASLASTPGVRV